MKKTILIILVCLFVTAGLFAARTRAYTQKVIDPNSVLGNQQFPDVTNGSTSTAPGYVVNAWIVSRPTEVTSTLTHVPGVIRLYRFGNGTTVPYDTRVFVQFANFATDWFTGDVLHVQVINNNVAPALDDYWELTIPDNLTSALTITVPQALDLWPVAQDHWTYNLQVNGPAGCAVTGPGTYAGTMPQLFTTGQMLADTNNLLGSWTAAAAPAGFHWVVNPIVVDATGWAGAKVDHVYAKTIEFELAPDIIPDTYTLHVTAVGPSTLIFKGGISTGQTAPHDFTGAAAADLIGVYSMDPAGLPAGWHWEPASIEVLAGDFVASKSGVQVWGTMSNGAKVAYAHGINFVQTEDAPTVIDPTIVPPVGIIVTPMGFGDVDPSLIGPDTGMPWIGYTINGSGVWTIHIPKPAAYGASDWYCWLQTAGGLLTAANPIPGATLFWDFPNVNLDAKGIVHAIINDNLTLPVELSSFTGMMTAEYFVQLNWTSQSETSLLGYRVLRSESTDVSNAVSITPTLVTATNTSTTQNYSITDTEVENNTTYSYWLESVNMDGTSEFHGPVSVLVQHEVPPVLPEYTSMRNAYPNPFAQNANTTIEVSVKEGETGTVTIYNILGQVVKTYTVREGLNNLNWNGKDSKGNTCGSGIYFYRLSTPSMNQTKKMVIVK